MSNMALATAVSTIDPYDSRLTYEERAKLRRKRRQESREISGSSTPSSTHSTPSPIFSPVHNGHESLTTLNNGHQSSSPEDTHLTAGLVTSQKLTSNEPRLQPVVPSPTQLSTSNFPQSKPYHSSLAQVTKDTDGRPGSPNMMMASRYLSDAQKEASLSPQQKGKFSFYNTEYVDNQTEFNSYNETNTTTNPSVAGEGLDLTPTNGEFGTLTSADSAFSEMFTEEQDGSKMSKPHVSNSTSFSFENFGGFEEKESKPRTFAEGLKFVDSSNDSQYGSSERSVSKAQVVYRPIDVSNTADITMIPSGGFFDPSQSQVDGDIGFLTAVSEPMIGDSSIKANKSKEKSKENRKSPSRFRLLNRNSKSKIIEEEPESEDTVGDDEDTPKIKPKFPKNRKESKTPSANVSKSAPSSSNTPTEPTPKKNSRDSSPSINISKPPLPSLATPKKSRPKKSSYSFRQTEKPKSPDFKSSMPNLTSPTHSRNSTVSPESFISSGSDDNSSGKKPSLRKRISQSLRDLVGKESPSSSSKSSWKFSEDVKPTNTNQSLRCRPIDETMVKLPSSVGETRVSSLSNLDRHSMHEDIEFIPESIETPIFEERAVDVEIVPIDRNSVSSDDYHTASESEQESGSAGLALTSIQILNSPTGLSQDFGYAPRKKNVDTPPVTSLIPAQDGSRGLTKASKSTTSLKQGTVVSGKGVRKAVSAQKNSSPKSSQRIASKSPVSGAVKKVGSPQISPRSSQRNTVAQSARKTTSSITVTVIGKSSPSSSPRSSLRVGASQLTKKPTPTSSPRSSLRMTTSKTSITKSPLPSQRATTSKLGTKSATSSQSSQRVTSSSVPQSISPRTTTSGSPQSPRKLSSRATPGKTGSPGASPRSSQRGTSITSSGSNVKSSISKATPGKTGSPTSSPRSSQRLGKVGTTSSVSPKSSPSPARKAPSPTTSKISPKKNSSPSIESPLLKRKQSSSLNKPSVPKLSKTSMEPVKEGDNNSDSFSRFTRGRTPIKIKGNDTTAERAKRLKEHRKSESFGLKSANSSKPDSARRATVIVARTPPPLVITAGDLTQRSGDPTQRSPDVTTPTTPGGTKKRKLGLTVAPILEELIIETAASPSKSTEQMNELVTKSAADISRDVDSLLSAVGQTLDAMALSDSTSSLATSQENKSTTSLKVSVDPQPPPLASMEVKVFEATPLHSRESSIDIDTFLEQAAEQEAVNEKEKQKKKLVKDQSPNISKKKTSLPPPKSSNSMSKTKSEPHIIGGAFTAALPPRPPLSKQTSETSTADRKTSKTGTNRPRQIIVAGTLTAAATTPQLRSSVRKSEPSTTTPQLRSGVRKSEPSKATALLSSASSNKTMPILKPQSKSTNTLGRFTSTGTTSSSGISSRSSMRASTKKISLTTPPLHGVKSSGTQSKDSTLSRIGDRSMKSRVSTTSRTGSATKKSSVGSGLSQDSASTRKVSTLSSPSRGRSMRRVSSGDLRKVKPGTSATLSRSSNSGVYSSMRKSGKFNTIRPRSSSNAGIPQSTNTMRRTPSGGRKVSTPSSTLTRKSVSASSVGSQSRKGTLKRTGSAGEGFAEFDHISSQAQGSMLSSSDHRRNIRPKKRQKASTTHLKILQQRPGVSSELEASSGSTPADNGLDANTFSTYMAKKNLAPSAMAGLAAKLDLSTVKLRKTGISDQMLSDNSGSSVDSKLAILNPSFGLEYNTTHPVMLLQIKGRRAIQTRLVDPSTSSLNSGDVFIALSEKKLVHWIGKSANVIEKARGSDVVMRILHKKELGCHATSPAVLKEEERAVNENTKKNTDFFDMIGGKKGVKSSESVPGDDIYEKAMNMVTVVYQLEGEGDKLQYTPIHDNSAQMVKVSLLNTKKILLFDFYGEVYVWVGKRSPGSQRKKAIEMGRKVFDAGCRPPVFNLRSSPARASGRYRPRSSIRSSRNSVLNASGRRSSKAKSELAKRPGWAMFARMSEGAENILFREKFGDWPEPGRIIKMKGHSSEQHMNPMINAVLQPADVEKMLKPTPPFEGLRLEGENVHRGQGNYKVSRSTFACNRVRPLTITKWVIREFENVEVPEADHGLFYTAESYVIRWAFIITVVRELDGLVPGQGAFARDRQYQKDIAAKKSRSSSPEAPKKKEERKLSSVELSDASDVEENDEESRRILETGGRERCAYFFWQGEQSSLNEKGASALMTVELDKERGPQVRVLEGKEQPAFLNLFSGSIILLQGRSQSDSLESSPKQCRMFLVRGQSRSETQLVEITPDNDTCPMTTCLRSRGCYVFYHRPGGRVYEWHGCKATLAMKRCAHFAAKLLKRRLDEVEMVTFNEGQESNEFSTLVGDKSLYVSLTNELRSRDYIPRLFELTSITGEFVATELLHPSRDGSTVAFPFSQTDLYSAVQPAMFLVDAWTEVYVWLGWWPQIKNKLLRETNATTGSAHSKWLRDKKLALETAELYVKACKRTRTPRAYMVTAGLEHENFTNLFPFWFVNPSVKELNSKGVSRATPTRVDAECELLKYTRNRFKLDELKRKPVPEGVDPARLETYLSDEDFATVFKLSKDAFASLSGWKQATLKKKVGLY